MDNSVKPAKIPRILCSSSSAISSTILNNGDDFVFEHDLNASIKKEVKSEPPEIKQEADDEMTTPPDLKDAKILQLQEENKSLKLEKKDFERKIKDLEAKNWKLSSNQTNQTLLLELNNQDLETDLAQRDDKVTILTQENKKLKDELEKLESEKAKCANDHMAVKESFDEKSKEVSDLQNDNLTLLGDNAGLSDSINKLNNDYQNILREKEDLIKNLDQMASQNAHLEEQNKKLTEGNQELSDFFKNHEDRQAAHLLQESLKVSDLEKEKSVKAAEIESLKKRIREIEELGRNQEDRINSLENDLEMYHNLVSTKVSEMADLKTENDDLTSRNKNLLFETRCINQKKEGLEKRVTHLQIALNDSQNHVAKKDVELDDLKREFESGKTHYWQLVGRYNPLLNNFNDLKKQHDNCAQMASNCFKLQNEVKVLRQTNNDIKVKLDLFEKASSLAFGMSFNQN